MDEDLKKCLESQPNLLKLIEAGKRREINRVVVCQSVGFHDDPSIHKRVVDHLEELGIEVWLAPDQKPDRGLAGRRTK